MAQLPRIGRIVGTALLYAIPFIGSGAAIGADLRRCVGTGAAQTPSEVVDAQFAAYNARDLDTFAACYADDITMVDLSGKNSVIHGKDELLKAFAYLRKPPKVAGTGVRIVERVVNGPIVVDKERPVGSPDGKQLPDLLAVYEVRDGRIVKVWFPPSR